MISPTTFRFDGVFDVLNRNMLNRKYVEQKMVKANQEGIRV